MLFSYMLFHFTYTDIPQPTGGTLTFKDVFRCISKFSICLNSSSHKPYSKFCFCMLPHEPQLNPHNLYQNHNSYIYLYSCQCLYKIGCMNGL